jgi:hypothetical protein
MDPAATRAAPRSRWLAPLPDETAPPSTVSMNARMATATARLSTSPTRFRTARAEGSATIVISTADGASAGPRRGSTLVSRDTQALSRT